MSFLEDLSKKILIADGAAGTLLYSQGVERCFEELNSTDSGKIINMHRTYIEAGAQVIQTNTYAANEIKLARYGLQHKASLLNTLGAGLAKEAAKNEDVYILGTMGGIRGIGKSIASMPEIISSFRNQLNTLLENEVDGLLLETFYDFEELKACLKIARKETDLPIVANVSLDEVGVLHGGIAIKDALLSMEDLGANVVGMNCRMGPFHMLKSFDEVPLLDNAYLSAYPNASLPDYKDGRLVYQTNPDYFGSSAKQFVEQGVRLIGGCCGTTPEHIRAAANAVKGLQPVTEKHVKKATKTKIIIKEKENVEALADIVLKRKSVIVELDPPKKLSVDRFLDGAESLTNAGVDAVTLADNSLASPRVCNLTLASMIKRDHGARPLVHITCRDRNLIGLQSHLMGLHTLGIDQVLAITGDPTKVGDFPGATSVYDLASFDFIRLIKQMNEGISFSGKDLGAKTNFSVGAAFNPNVTHLNKAVERMEKKIEYGADYFLTQPIFDKEKIRHLYEATKHLNVPIYVGVMPLTSVRNAEFLHNEVPGIKLTDETRERIASCQQDRDSMQKEGIQIAKELIDEVYRYFNGLYLITPFMRYGITTELTRYWKEKTVMVPSRL